MQGGLLIGAVIIQQDVCLMKGISLRGAEGSWMIQLVSQSPRAVLE